MNTTIKRPDPIRNVISNGASKKSLCYLIIVLAVALLIFGGLLYYLSRKPRIEEEQPTEKTIEEIIQDLTAPEGVAEPVSEEVMEIITAPESKKEPSSVPEDVLKNLTAPK